jgi:spermidine/putrescine transport system ATP-binding protein
MSEFLICENVHKRFGNLEVLKGVSLAISKGEIFSLLGPSGCGKTTLLRICAGFEQPDSGRIILDGKDITDLPPNERRVNTIFQNYALFPHLTLRQNIGFGLRIAKRPTKEIAHEVDRMLELMQLEEHADKRPHQISGGQKQRVAIARALINKPQVLLLDEPLAALDLKLRQRMLVELDEIHDEVGITFLYITHDQGEAMGLSDRIAVMNHGIIEQTGKPATLYEAPCSSFVAAFIGDTNFFDGRVASIMNQDYIHMQIEGLADAVVFNDKHIRAGDPVHLSIRPEKIRISLDEPAPADRLNRMPGKVEDAVYLGSHTKYWVRVKEYRVAVNRQHSRFLLDEKPIRWGDEVWLSWYADDGYMLERYEERDEAMLSLPPEEVVEANAE